MGGGGELAMLRSQSRCLKLAKKRERGERGDGWILYLTPASVNPATGRDEVNAPMLPAGACN